MTDPQITAIALASVSTTLSVVVGILINNSRLNDLNTSISELRAHFDIRFEEMNKKLRSERC